MEAELRSSRQPPPTPGCEATSPARLSRPRMRRMKTGLVLTLPAMDSEVTTSSPAWARSVRI